MPSSSPQSSSTWSLHANELTRGYDRLRALPFSLDSRQRLDHKRRLDSRQSCPSTIHAGSTSHDPLVSGLGLLPSTKNVSQKHRQIGP